MRASPTYEEKYTRNLITCDNTCLRFGSNLTNFEVEQFKNIGVKALQAWWYYKSSCICQLYLLDHIWSLSKLMIDAPPLLTYR